MYFVAGAEAEGEAGILDRAEAGARAGVRAGAGGEAEASALAGAKGGVESLKGAADPKRTAATHGRPTGM